MAWDSVWYRHIAANGYRTVVPPTLHPQPDQSNVAFLPGYPFWGRTIHKVFNTRIDEATWGSTRLLGFLDVFLAHFASLAQL